MIKPLPWLSGFCTTAAQPIILSHETCGGKQQCPLVQDYITQISEGSCEGSGVNSQGMKVRSGR